jgi:hypothetical protein
MNRMTELRPQPQRPGKGINTRGAMRFCSVASHPWTWSGPAELKGVARAITVVARKGEYSLARIKDRRRT